MYVFSPVRGESYIKLERGNNMKFLTNIDLNKNELQNAIIQVLAAAPASGQMGQVYYNSTDNKLYQHDGTSWKEVGVTYTQAYGTLSSNAVPLTLTGSDGSTSTVTIEGAGNTTLSVNNGTLTITTSDTTYTYSGAVDVDGYVVTVTPSSGSAQTYTIPFASASTGGLMSASDYSKLAGIAGAGTQSQLETGTDTGERVWQPKILHDYISSVVGAADAMRFKGTIGTDGDITTLPSSGVKVGDTYRVVEAGTYAGQVCEVGDLIIATATTPTWTVAQTNIDGAITSISGTSPISVTGSGASRTVAHENSGVTAASKGDTSNQTPSFGDSFKVLSGTVNATGHLTAFDEHNVTIPSDTATSSADGLMSSTDKAKLDSIDATKTGTATITAGQTSVTESVADVISYKAIDATSGAQLMVDYVKGSGSVTFSITSAYANNITITYIAVA